MKPSAPSQSRTSRAVMVKPLVSSAQSSVGITVARTISTPPMVGVPCLPRCVCGPSVRTTWPTFSIRSRRMIGGAEVEGHQERRHHRPRRPEGLEAEEVEDDVVLRQRHQEVVEHGFSA